MLNLLLPLEGTSMTYCPRCKSKLFPADEESIRLINVCSGCISYSKPLQQQYAEAVAKNKQKRNFNMKQKVKRL